MADYRELRQEYVDNKGDTDVIDDYKTGFMTREEYDEMLSEMGRDDIDEERREEVRNKLRDEREWYERFELLMNDREKEYERKIEEMTRAHKEEIDRLQRERIRSFINTSNVDLSNRTNTTPEPLQTTVITNYDDLWRE